MKIEVINIELIERLAVYFKNIVTKQAARVEPFDIATIEPCLVIARICFEAIDELAKEKGVKFAESELNNPKEMLYPNSKPIPILNELNSRLLPRLDKIRPKIIEGIRVGDIISDIITEIGYPGMLRIALNIIYSYTEDGQPYEDFIKPYKMGQIGFRIV